jgi:hypothetical protein
MPDKTAKMLGTVLDNSVSDASHPSVSAVIVLNRFEMYSFI